MNRRNFLKRCSLIPFVGSLAIVAKTGASEGLTVAKLQKCKRELGTQKSKEELDWSKTWIASDEDIKALGNGDCGYVPKNEEISMRRNAKKS